MSPSHNHKLKRSPNLQAIDCVYQTFQTPAGQNCRANFIKLAVAGDHGDGVGNLYDDGTTCGVSSVATRFARADFPYLQIPYHD